MTASMNQSIGQSSNNPFGSSSVFGQNNNPNYNPFGSQTGSSIFGGTSTDALGTQASSPVFSISSAPAFGASSSPSFGVSSSSFDSSSVFGQMPASSLFRSTTQSSSTESSFQKPKLSTSSSFSFVSSPAFGQSTSAFGSSPFGATSTTVDVQRSPSGCRCPGFCQPCFRGQQLGGTRVAPYAQTPEAYTSSGTQPAGKLESISAMPTYKEKRHEELRWEDYQSGDKGGPNPAAQSSSGTGFNMNNTQQSNPFASASPAFGQSSANTFSFPTSTTPVAPKTSTRFWSSTPSHGSLTFAKAKSRFFGSMPSSAPSVYGSTPACGSTTFDSFFGPPSSSAPSAYGSTSAAFGSTTFNSIFGAQAKGTTSLFGTGLNFASTQSSPLYQSTTPTLAQTSSLFGSTSIPAFGSTSTPASGTTSTPAFGSTSTPASGATSMPACGSTSTPTFGSTSTSASGATSMPAFGSTSTPAFGSTSTPASGATSTPAFGSTSTPAFSSTSTSAFGATSTPAFGSTSSPTFGNTGSAFGVSSSSVFGSSTPAFGASSTSAFGSTSTTPTIGQTCSPFGSTSTTPTIGQTCSSTPAFGASSTLAFGASSTPEFGASSTSPFGASSTTASAFYATCSSFSFSSSPAFCQSTSTFGRSSPSGATSTAFGAQSSSFGGQTTTPTCCSPRFGQPYFGGQQHMGTRVISYAETPEANGDSYAGKLKSIAAMHAYKEKSHGELRWEDYQRGDKGDLDPAARSSGGMSFNPFAPMSSSITSTNHPFGPMTSTFRSTPSLGSSPFDPAACNPFKSTPSPAPSAIGSTSSFGPTPMIITTPTLVQPSFSFSSPTPSLGSSPFDTATSNPFWPTPSNLFWSTPPSSNSFWSTPPPSNPFWSTGGTSSNFGRVVDKRAPMKISCALTSRHLSKTCPKNESPKFSFISKEEKTTSTTPAFGQPSFEVPQSGLTRVIPYGPTTVTEYEYGTQFAGNMESISAMLAYKEQSHEELRWADYQVGYEGGPILMLNLFVEWSLI